MNRHDWVNDQSGSNRPERKIPFSLAEVCMHGLAKLPNDRYQSAGDMATALTKAMQSLDATGPRCQACGAPDRTANPVLR